MNSNCKGYCNGTDCTNIHSQTEYIYGEKDLSLCNDGQSAFGFISISLADTLGSGTRKLFKYSRYYSGKDTEFKEGDVFRIVVPLDDTYSYDFNLGNGDKNEKAVTNFGTIDTIHRTDQDEVSDEQRLLQLLAC